MNPYKIIGNRLKEERIRLKLTQADAGMAVGVSREMWGRYERGSKPGDEVASKLQSAGFDVDYIFTGIKAEAYEASIRKAERQSTVNDAERLAGMYAMLSEPSQRVLIDTARRLRELELLLKTELEK